MYPKFISYKVNGFLKARTPENISAIGCRIEKIVLNLVFIGHSTE